MLTVIILDRGGEADCGLAAFLEWDMVAPAPRAIVAPDLPDLEAR